VQTNNIKTQYLMMLQTQGKKHKLPWKMIILKANHNVIL